MDPTNGELARAVVGKYSEGLENGAKCGGKLDSRISAVFRLWIYPMYAQ